MKTIEIEIPDGYEAKWVDGVLTLVAEKPKVEYKYKVGDKVALQRDTVFHFGKEISLIKSGVIVEVTAIERDYIVVSYKTYTGVVKSENLRPADSKDITERIKTFEDACRWCMDNEYNHLVRVWEDFNDRDGGVRDVEAYLKLRIITCALNEGWEPKFEECEHRFYALYKDYNQRIVATSAPNIGAMTPYTLYFKSHKLAIYAATQFKDIYMDFCYKGKE